MTNLHYKKLENVYLQAPINGLYKPTIEVREGSSKIEAKIDKNFFHGANALHGSVYFKMLDDAAFFAVNSVVEDVFVLTGKFEIKFLKPLIKGTITAYGELINNKRNIFDAEAELYNSDNVIVALGKGTFHKSKIKLESIKSYQY